MEENCRLADAIKAANTDTVTGGCPAGDGADVIALSADIILVADLPRVTSDITLRGSGFTISGDDEYRIFYVGASGKLTIERLILLDGKANEVTLPVAGAIEAGGAIFNQGVLSESHSIFSDNSARFGGAIMSGADLSVGDSTFSGNSADSSGGSFEFRGTEKYNSTATLTHVTLARNVAKRSGGIFVAANNAVVSLRNGIIVSNIGGNCFGELNQDVGNLIEDGNCFAEISGDPMLGDLVEPEDCSPAYLPLLGGSPAIDAAHPAYCSETDQIGTERPQGRTCDIGAIEYVPDK